MQNPRGRWRFAALLSGSLALLILLGSTQPTCTPVEPAAPVCLSVEDCAGLTPAVNCVGQWACLNAACEWQCASACPTDVPAALGKVSPADLLAELEAKDFLLINVHVPYAGEIPGTDIHLTYADVPAIAAWIGPDKATKVVVYCLSNYMSNIAGKALADQGYCNVRLLDGGMGAWKAAGYPFTNP
jgi:rhodanese-related sulfurtransferase